MQRSTIRLAYVFGTCALIYAVMAIFVWLCPPNADDLCYGYGTPFSLGDIIAAQIAEYFGWTGRSVAHVIARCLLSAPPVFAVALTPLVAVWFLLLSVPLALGRAWRKQVRAWHIAVMFGLLWFFLPAFGERFFWITGSSDYLWVLVFCMAFLVPLRFLYDDAEYCPPRWVRALYPLLGLLAGWSQESVCVLAVSLSAASIGMQVWRKKRVPLWLWLGTCTALAGAALLLLAPGNYQRMHAPEYAAYRASSWLERIQTFIPHYWAAQGKLLPLYGIASWCLWKLHRCNQVVTGGEWKFLFLLAALGQGSLVMLVAAPYVPERLLGVAFVCHLLLVMYLLQRVAALYAYTWRIGVLAGVLCCTLAFSVVTQLHIFYDFHTVYAARIALLQSDLPHVTLPPYPEANKYAFMGGEKEGDISLDNDYWINAVYRKVYKKDITLGLSDCSNTETEVQLGGESLSVAMCAHSLLRVRKGGQSRLGEGNLWLALPHAPYTPRYFLQHSSLLFAAGRSWDVVENRIPMKLRFALKKCIFFQSPDGEEQWMCRIPDFARGKDMMLGVDTGETFQYRKLDVQSLE